MYEDLRFSQPNLQDITDHIIDVPEIKSSRQNIKVPIKCCS